MANDGYKSKTPGKYEILGTNWKEVPSFGNRKAQIVNPQALITEKGNVIIFDKLEQQAKSGPVGNESALFDRVGEEVPAEIYSVLNQYTAVPPIVQNMQFDSMRNPAELVKYLRDPTSYGIASGRKPSGPCHFGHKLVIETIDFFQRNGAQIFVPIADSEASLDPKITQRSQHRYFAADNLLDWGACGLNLDAAHVYLQSEEMRVINITYAVVRKLDLATCIDIYGRQTMVDETNFLFASLSQVGDILLPQHPDFGRSHSFMLSGADQDGNMAMTTTLAGRALETYANDPSATRYVKSAPSSLYVRSISNLDGEKESASEPDTTIYLGPSRNVYGRTEKGGKVLQEIRTLSLSDRIEDSFEKIDRFNAKNSAKVAEAILRRQPLFVEFAGQKSLDAQMFKDQLTEILGTHQGRRQAVFEYAIRRALQEHAQNGTLSSEQAQRLIMIAKERIPYFEVGIAPVAPRFWDSPEEAHIPEAVKKVSTKWFHLVAEAAEKLTM